jgi:hypothetical protein
MMPASRLMNVNLSKASLCTFSPYPRLRGRHRSLRKSQYNRSCLRKFPNEPIFASVKLKRN